MVSPMHTLALAGVKHTPQLDRRGRPGYRRLRKALAFPAQRHRSHAASHMSLPRTRFTVQSSSQAVGIRAYA